MFRLSLSRFRSHVLPVCAVALGLAHAPSAWADTLSSTWGGGVSGDWSVSANWTPNSAYPNNGADTYQATIGASTVQLTEDITISGLSLNGTTLGGTHTLTTGSITLASATTFESGLNVTIGSSFAFADPSASLANHGTLQFDTSDFYASTATLTNASDGTIRFNSDTSISVGDSDTSPFSLVNHGTVLSDAGAYSYNYFYAPVTQSASGLISVTSGGLYLYGGGTLGGTLNAAADSQLSITGYDKTYTFDQTIITGAGIVGTGYTTITGSLASGSLHVYTTAFTGSFVNESAATLHWENYTRFADANASLTNHGILQFDTGSSGSPSLYFDSTAILTNASDGIIRFKQDTSISVGDSDTSPFSLVNHGTVLSDAGAYSYNYFYAPVTQSASGLISVTSGGFYLYGGGTLGGTLNAAADSQLSITGYDKTYTFDQTVITGAGIVGTGYTTITGSLASGSLHVYTTAFTGSFVNESAATLHWENYTRFADANASLTNHGILQFDTGSSGSPSLYFDSTAILTNASDGTIRFKQDTSISVGDSDTSPFSLVNHGTVLSDAGAYSYNYFYAPVTQSASGLISVTSGGLYLYGGGTLGGALNAAADSQLSITGYDKTYTFDQTIITGAGIVGTGYTTITGSLASGSLHVYTTAFTGAFINESAATLHWENYTRFADSSASLTNHGILQFDTGSSGSPSLYFDSTAILTNASDGTIRFKPDTSISVGHSDTSPFLLVNNGTVLSENGQSNSLYVPITNTGLIRVVAGSGLSLQGSFLQTAGEVCVENANLSSAFNQTLVFQGGLLRASGYISAGLSLTATAWEIGLGETAATLSVYGDVALFEDATITFDIRGTVPGTGHDSLSITGDLTLGGSLEIRLAAAFADSISASDEFTILTATSIGGTFANALSGERVYTADGRGSFLITLTGTTLVLSDFSPVPEPAVYGALTGLLALGWCLRRRRKHTDSTTVLS